MTCLPAIRNEWWMQKKNRVSSVTVSSGSPLPLRALGAEVALGSEEEEGALCPLRPTAPRLAAIPG